MSQVGEGVHDIYKERAHKGGDILWHVTIKGQKKLAEGIPLHMSLKVFEDKKDMNLNEIKEKIKDFNIKRPNPKELKFKTTVFTSDFDGKKYYMLLIEGTDKVYENFYDSMKHCGTVYKKFMPHITIDKGLYDKINEEGLGSEEIEFSELTIEAGAGNTVYKFEKSFKLDTVIMKETIWMNMELSEKHGGATFLESKLFDNYLEDHPGLKEEILHKHEERINHHFGTNEELSLFARKFGINETYKLMRSKQCK